MTSPQDAAIIQDARQHIRTLSRDINHLLPHHDDPFVRTEIRLLLAELRQAKPAIAELTEVIRPNSP